MHTHYHDILQSVYRAANVLEIDVSTPSFQACAITIMLSEPHGDEDIGGLLMRIYASMNAHVTKALLATDAKKILDSYIFFRNKEMKQNFISEESKTLISSQQSFMSIPKTISPEHKQKTRSEMNASINKQNIKEKEEVFC